MIHRFSCLLLLTLSALFFSSSTHANNSHAVVLLYHHVSSETPAITSISPDKFEEQLDYIQQNGFSVWPLTKIMDHLDNDIQIPDKTLAITFDDAYQSIYSEAYPRLKSRGMPFTIFVTTESIDQRYNNQLTWQELSIMAKNGASLANHTVSHAHLLHRPDNETDLEWQQRMRKEIQEAQQRISEETGSQLKLFAYPYGEHNEALKKIAKELGYTAFGQQSGAIGPLTNRQSIPRFPIAGNYIDIDDFKLKINTLAMPATDISQQDNPLEHQLTRPTLSLSFVDTVNKQALQCFGSGQGKLNITWSGNTATVTPNSDIPIGRSRYNCTYPVSKGRF